jgi:lipid A 3-O-deacylase
MELPAAMKGNSKYLLPALLALSGSCLADSTPHYGATFSVPVISKEPEQLHGFQLMFNYDPQRYKWRQFNVYLDGGFSRFYQNQTAHNTFINIYSIAPVVRYTFKKRGPVLPYLELSVGFSYLSSTRIENRNLGIHFSFQDRMGIGALIGASEKLSLGVHAVHYSNSHLSAHNSGITIPLVLDVGYRFS